MAPASTPGPLDQVPEKVYATTLKLSLEEAIRLGLQSSIDVRQARLDDRIAGRDVVAARSVFDPFFSVNANYAKNRDPSVSFFDLGPGGVAQGVQVSPSKTTQYSAGVGGAWLLGTQYNIRLGQVERNRPTASQGGITFLNPVTVTEAYAELRQPLLRGAWTAVNGADIRIARNNQEVSRLQLELTVTSTVYSIIQAYWELAFANRNLEAKRKAFALSLENLENVRRKRQVGTLAAIDVTTAESSTALRRVELVDAIELRELTRDQLLRLLNYTQNRSRKELWQGSRGDDPFDSIHVICTSTPSAPTAFGSREDALALAFAERPEYQQLKRNFESQGIRIEVAKNALLPALDVVGRWTQLGLDDNYSGSYSSLDSGRFYDWSIGVEMSVPLSNRGAKSRYRNARDLLRKLRLSKVDLENAIILEVDQALRKVQYLEEKARSLDERVRLQEQLLQAERRKVDVGMSILYTVNVIENDLVLDQAQALRARADLENAKNELKRATGTLLEDYGIHMDLLDHEADED